jgi:cell fate regulator YaaT (PSP1 superfamily)
MSEGQVEGRTVVAVRLRYNPKAFWFDPALSTYEAGDHVLVDTERGREIGLVINPVLEVTKAQLDELKTPLKPVIRVLTEIDYDLIDELDAKGKAAMPIFRELIEKHQLDMKPVSVDYLFSGDKAVFYFSNDERVDFRDLVRDLVSRLHIRVDMRQIGIRDEARIIGGFAHCGEELCCSRLGGEFQPVSIRIAKEQDLPLNPAKISGACGRLMCCLRYEFEAYKDFKNRAPKRGALIETPIGQAKVIDFDTPREIITMRLEDGKQLSIPLSEFECSEDDSEDKRPCRVSKEAINRCASSGILMTLANLEQEFAQSAAPAKDDSRPDAEGVENERAGRRPRRASRSKSEDAGDSKPADAPRQPRAPRQSSAQRQPSVPRQADGERQPNAPRQADSQKKTAPSPKQDDRQRKSPEKREGATPRKRSSSENKSKPRPGQHSSGLRNTERTGSQNGGRPGDAPREQQGESGAKRPEKRSADGSRRRWRRSGSSQANSSQANPPSSPE